MPVHNRFFIQPDGKINPNILVSIGPLLSVEVSVPKELADFFTREKKLIPPPKTGFALIDTGATRSGVDKSVITQLGVQPVGVARILTASGEVEQNLFPAHFRFPGENIDIDFSSVLGVNLSGQNINGQPIIALLGRDILSKFIFIYNGPGGFFSIAY